jgi:uncharacterized protein
MPPEWREKIKYDNIGFIGIAIIIFALIFFFAAKSFSRQGAFVEVKGLSERIVKADRAIWSLNFEAKSNNIDALSAEIEKNITSVKTFLTQKGFEASEINVAPINIYQDTYSEALFRYNANVQMSVYTPKVDLVKSASGETLALVRQGVSLNQNFVNFEFSDINSVKPAMLAEAIENARTSAEQFADSSGSSLGIIARANQGVIDITDKDPGSPEYKKIRVVTTVRFLLK